MQEKKIYVVWKGGEVVPQPTPLPVDEKTKITWETSDKNIESFKIEGLFSEEFVDQRSINEKAYEATDIYKFPKRKFPYSIAAILKGGKKKDGFGIVHNLEKGA